MRSPHHAVAVRGTRRRAGVHAEPTDDHPHRRVGAAVRCDARHRAAGQAGDGRDAPRLSAWRSEHAKDRQHDGEVSAGVARPGVNGLAMSF